PYKEDAERARLQPVFCRENGFLPCARMPRNTLVPTLRVGMPSSPLCGSSIGRACATRGFPPAADGVLHTPYKEDAERARLHSHAERGNERVMLGESDWRSPRFSELHAGILMFSSNESTIMSTDPTTSQAVSVDALRAFCLEALAKVGVGEEDARTTADVLVTTDTWGVFTHGVKALLGYARRLRGGGLRADARPTIVSDGPAWAIVDGGSALGMVTSVLAMRTAAAKARASGIGSVGVRNSCHFGAAGYYAHLAAAEGCIGLAMANDVPSVAAPGSRGAVTGSNPLAYAVPTRSGRSILLDMATSTVAGG